MENSYPTAGGGSAGNKFANALPGTNVLMTILIGVVIIFLIIFMMQSSSAGSSGQNAANMMGGMTNPLNTAMRTNPLINNPKTIR